MEVYNQLLYMVLKSFDIDIEKVSIDQAVELLLDEAVIDEKMDKALKICIEKIIDIKDKDPKTYEDMVLCIVRDFISKSLDSDSPMLKLLEMSSQEEVFDYFSSNPSFSNLLMTNFVYNLFLTDNKIVENYENFDLLQKFSDSISITYLNDIIRNALIRINTYFTSPKGTYEFIETIFYNDVYVEDVPLQKAIAVLKCYQKIVMRLIYADVYGLVLTLDEKRNGVQQIKSYIERCLKKNDFVLNPSFGLENEAIFKCFYYLNSDKRKENNDSLNDKQKDVVKRIYPLYMVDSSGIIKK